MPKIRKSHKSRKIRRSRKIRSRKQFRRRIIKGGEDPLKTFKECYDDYTKCMSKDKQSVEVTQSCSDNFKTCLTSNGMEQLVNDIEKQSVTGK